MNKAELVSAIALKSGATKKSVDQVVSAFTEVVQETLVNGGEVVLVGFGVFETRSRKERAGRNPKTGEQMTIAAKTVVGFSVGKQLREAVEDLGIGKPEWSLPTQLSMAIA